jgi:nonsense-mediated mRNA decay protein 3
MFCVECGKEGPIFRDGVCIECYKKTHTFTSGPNEIEIPICSHCGGFKYKNLWTNEIFGDVLKRYIKNTYKISRELKKVDINTECEETKQGFDCKVLISGFVDDLQINEEHNLSVRLKKTVCDVCSKQFGGYHEAIIQVRTQDKKLSKKEINNIIVDVENYVANVHAKGDRTLFITDITKEHGGIDFYLSDKNAAQVIAKNLHEQFGGEMKQSSKNIGMKDGRQLYRNTYLVRIPSYNKGDFIKIDEGFYKIIGIQSNNIKLLDLSSWKETTVDAKNIQNSKIYDKTVVKDMILVSQNENEVQVMNEESYKINIIKKPKNIAYKTNKISVIKIEDCYFILPISN